ncbi:GTP cyclohydrolase 1-like [Tasmannia lanceolata]|uniref:GTP cyclohydrolase 1-like n=1 Tax=Tasmannia lanceolata TaxID=3420 RepID=UPI004063AFB5
MGAFDEGHLDAELENGVKLGFLELGLEDESETSVIENAVKILLQGLGEDSNREGLRKTPLRVAKALLEGTKGYKQKAKDIVQGALFPEAGLDGGVGHAGGAGGAGGLVVVRDIDIFSYCESCLLPFKVQCHVGYVPSGQRVVGLSKLPRVADIYAKRLQDPQRLSDQVCMALHNSINPAGVAIILQCWHIKFPALASSSHRDHNSSHATKGDMQGWVQVLVSSGSGVFGSVDSDAWGDFLALLKFRGVNMERRHVRFAASQHWCPSTSEETVSSNGHTMRNPLNGKISSKAGASQAAMVAAVVSILRSLGEDPLRKELVLTPHRFVQWLMNFKTCNFSYGEMGLRNLNLHRKTADLDQNRFKSELNLPFWSQCEHHLLPFHGVAHIAYFHVEDIEVERYILQSIVNFHGCKLQVQERLTRQIAETVYSLSGRGVMVVVEAQHICMMSRGIEKVGSITATIAVLGQFLTDTAAKEIFLQTVSNSTTASRG